MIIRGMLTIMVIRIITILGIAIRIRTVMLLVMLILLAMKIRKTNNKAKKADECK